MTSKLTITDERLAELVAFKPLPGTDITSATRDEWMAMAAELQERRKAEKNCEPVAYMTYKGYLLHAGDPKLAEFSEPTPLYADPRPAAMPAAPVAWLWSRDGDDERDVSLTPPDDDADAADAIECGWTASPLYRHAQQPVVDADDNFYSWFGREWQENYQHNQYTTAAKQMLGVMAESAWKAGRRAAMLQELQKSAGVSNNCRSNEKVQAVQVQPVTSINPAPAMVSLPKNSKSLAGNSPVIGIDPASGPDRTVEVRYVSPPGYVMVPKEPTREILDEFDSIIDYGAEDSEDAWRRLLAAAPKEVNHG